jgi:1-aminocyclopropane-1-carboxylate deaminase
VRGEDVENPTLDYVRSTGTQLHFSSRSEYRKLKEETYFERYPNAYVIPEGGTNVLALKGIGEMMDEINIPGGIQYCVSYGSGATSIGMMKKLSSKDHLHIFSSLKLKDFDEDFNRRCAALDTEISPQVSLHSNYHFGGFAKFDNTLINFINSFPLPLDPIYTGKMMFGIQDLIDKKTFDKRPILAVHTGGLQGVRGFNMRFGNLITGV